ncbi:MAG: hypothetical protein ACE5F8_05390 [Woeseiaceae bacterium]
MGDDLYKTIKIKRDRNVGTDSQGRTVWTKPVEETELELVSTQELRKILDSDDDGKKEKIRALADTQDGVLACSTSSGEFEILAESELEAALQAANDPDSPFVAREVTLESISESDGDEELSLVSTQALRKVLNIEDPADAEADDDDAGAGYNPYDRG